jgi:hypothetical protein
VKDTAIDPGRVPAWRLLLRFAAMDARLAGARWMRSLGFRPLRTIALDPPVVPDSEICRRAWDLARTASTPVVLNHAMRTHAFGAVLAARSGIRLDPEVFFVAAVLHDLGLTAASETEDGSFEWVGARRAAAFCAEHGLDARRTRLVHDAVALHSSVGLAHHREPEVALVHFGAGVDVLGLRLDEIPTTLLRTILERHPRLAFKHCFATLLERQATTKPRSHIAGPLGLGFVGRLRAAPFEE